MSTATHPHDGVTRNLYCNCCGGCAGRHKQHWNQDTGYGICRNCITRAYRGKAVNTPEGRAEMEATILDYFGVEGVNWANAEQWAEFEAKNQ